MARVVLARHSLPRCSSSMCAGDVPESPVYTSLRERRGEAHFLDIFAPPLRRTTVLASLLCTGMLGAYYAVNTWLPTYLSTERHLSAGGTSRYLLILIAGSFAGYLTSAWLSDVLGRRRCFMLFAAGGAHPRSRLHPGRSDRHADDGPRVSAGIFSVGYILRHGGVSRGALPERRPRLRTRLLL